jgi:enoyl-CoA hydratase/carnithine racemase
MLYAAEMLRAEDMKANGFAAVIAPSSELDAVADQYVRRISSLAPLTLRALKSINPAFSQHRSPANAGDMIRLCYGSRDFKEGVQAFIDGRKPQWSGA